MTKTLTCLFTFLTFTLLAQANFVEGTITKLNGETLAGQIDYREWTSNPTQIQFRKTTISATETFTVNDLDGFKINHNQEEYKAATVFYNTGEVTFKVIDKDKEIIEPQINVKKGRFFLLTLLKGKINLFTLNQIHYFIQKEHQIYPLLYAWARFRSNSTHIEEKKYRKVIEDGVSASITTGSSNLYTTVVIVEYRKQLSTEMADCPKIAAIADKLNEFNYRSITDIVKKYNETMGATTYIKPRDKAEKSFFVYGGAAQSYFTLKEYAYSETAGAQPWLRFNSSPMPTFGLGIEFGIIRSINKLSVVLEGNYLESAAQTVAAYPNPSNAVDYKIDMKGLRYNGSLKYVLYKGVVQPYVKAGIGLSNYWTRDLAVSPQSPHSDRPLLKSELSAIGSVGLKTKGFFLESRYERGTDINRNIGKDLKMHRFSVVAGYAFKL